MDLLNLNFFLILEHQWTWTLKTKVELILHSWQQWNSLLELNWLLSILTFWNDSWLVVTSQESFQKVSHIKRKHADNFVGKCLPWDAASDPGDHWDC